MKIFANRGIWKKVVIIFSLIFSMSFVEPAPVKAGIGGTLMEPICDLLVGLADGAMNILQDVLIGQEEALIRVNLNTTIRQIARVIVTGLILLLVLTVAVVATGGGVLVAGAVAAKLGLAAGVLKAGVIISAIVPTVIAGCYFGAKAYNMDAFTNEIVLPLYSLSPERIFSNTYPLFDVNFFNPSTQSFEYEWAHHYSEEELEDTAGGKYSHLSNEDSNVELDWSKGIDVTDEVNKDYSDVSNARVLKAIQIEVNGTKYVKFTLSVPSGEAGTIERETIRKINDGTSSGDASSSSGTEKKWAFTKDLQATVKFWYSILRTLAIVGMMSVLVYIGIRILLSSTAEQKSKYKQLLGDWIVGMVLLFTMQYIMVFANIAVDHITDLFKNINPMGQTVFIPDNKGKVKDELKEWNISVIEGGNSSDQSEGQSSSSGGNMEVYRFTDKGGDTYIEWHTDLMGQLRIGLQAHRDDSEKYIGYTLMFIVMVIYTCIFCFTYIKRVVYMAFLTIISPLVALTYPIDKVNDGSAQGFNYWFKEYIFNLLLQPVHLLIYTILVSTAIKLAVSNMIYSLVALGFITQAEKIVRQMFNFSKASTPGVFSGPAGAAMAMTGMRWLMGHGPNGAPGGGKLAGASGGASSTGGRFLKTKDDKDIHDHNTVVNSLLGIESSAEGEVASAVAGEAANVVASEAVNIGGNAVTNIVNGSDGDNAEESASTSFLGRIVEPELGENEATPNSDGERTQLADSLSNGKISRSVEPSMSADIASDGLPLESQNLPEGQIPQDQTPQDTSYTTDVSGQDQAEGEVQIGEQNEPARRSIRGVIGTTLSEYGDGISYKIAQSIYNAKPGRKIARTMGGAFGAAALGTFGVATGIASGDMKSVMTNGIAGVAGGYKLGSGVVGSASNALHVEGLDEKAARAYYGDEAIARENRERIATQKEWIDKIMEKEGKTKNEAIKRAKELSDYIKYGQTDIGDILKMEKFIDNKKFKNSNGEELSKSSQREMVSKLNNFRKKYEISKMNGAQEKEKRVKQFAQDSGKDETQSARIIDMTRDLHNFMED